MTKPTKPTPIDPSPDAPDRLTDSPQVFPVKAVAFLDWQTGTLEPYFNVLLTYVDESNDYVDLQLSSAQQAVTDATTQAGIATTQAGIATTQAGIATTQAGQAESFRDESEVFAAAAQAAAGAPSLTELGYVLTIVPDGFGGKTVGWESGVVETVVTKTFGVGEQFIVSLSEPQTGPLVVSASVETPQVAVTNNQWETAVAASEFEVDSGLQFGANGLEIDLTGGTYVGGYLAARTTSDTNTDYWTDINGMSANDSENGEFIAYAISDDAANSFYIVSQGSGSRLIARNNGGTWEVNNSGQFSGSVWIPASENTVLGALRESPELGLLAFDISTTAYDSVSLGVNSQDSSPNALAFSPDGTKMFMAGAATASVYQYTLSTGFDLSTVSYDSVSFSVSGQESSPEALVFSPDGTKMFILGSSADSVRQYTLSTGFDLSTVSYDSVSFSVSGQHSVPLGLAFSPDGTKMYVTGASGVVYQYALATGFDVGTASYGSVNFNAASQETNIFGLAFSPDGTKMFICGSSNIHQYTLSTAFNVSTASYDSESFSTSAQGSSCQDVVFSVDGTRTFVVLDSTNAIYQYSSASGNIMTPAQLSSASDDDFPAVTSTLGLAVILRTDDGGVTPTSNGVTVNYDGNVAHQGAVIGTDFDWQQLDDSTVRFTALTGGNYKLRFL